MKDTIRKRVLQERKIIDQEKYFQENQKILHNIREVLNSINKCLVQHVLTDTMVLLVIGLYYPLVGEPNLLKLSIEKKEKYGFALPKIGKFGMEFIKYESGDDLKMSSFYGLMHPVSNVVVIPDIIIIPALAYSLKGYRVGFGVGYYDKFFANLEVGKKIMKIGVCFHNYLCENISHEPHDLKADYVITDKIIISL